MTIHTKSLKVAIIREPAPQHVVDRFKAMSDEELAEHCTRVLMREIVESKMRQAALHADGRHRMAS